MQDSTYQDRYAARTADKIAAIIRAFNPGGQRCLDIGCNRGYLCGALLGSGAMHVTGADLTNVVTENIRTNIDFDFWECDIAAVTVRGYDVTYCLSVLHHVLGHYGWDTYEATLRGVLQSAPVVFMEVGVPSEEGRFYWKDRILEHFPTDGPWLATIIGHPLVDGWRSIASLPIHGSFRHVYRIETVTLEKTP